MPGIPAYNRNAVQEETQMKRAYVLGTTLGVCLAVAGLVAHCSIVDSTNVRTAGIWAHYTVEHDAFDSVTVRGVLRVGGSTGTIVDLTAGSTSRSTTRT
jgi:hypothetical protein